MSNKEIEAVKTKLLDINEFISKLDPAIRTAAFEILRAIYFGQQQEETKVVKKVPLPQTHEGENPATDLESFIKPHEHNKPADNVLLLAAWLYSNYGAYPITAKEIKELGDSCGLVVPNRSDNTMRQAKNKSKGLFQQQGKGFRPTVTGELFLKETYKVKKGNKSLPNEE